MKRPPNNFSLFVWLKGEKLKETHDLTELEAFKAAMRSLYYFDGFLRPHIGIVIRTKDNLVFTANNP